MFSVPSLLTLTVNTILQRNKKDRHLRKKVAVLILEYLNKKSYLFKTIGLSAIALPKDLLGFLPMTNFKVEPLRMSS